MGQAVAEPTVTVTTKHQAFDDFMTNRVMGEDLFAIKVLENLDGSITCVYNHAVNGGCAIGKHIPVELYRPDIEGRAAQTLFQDERRIEALFEEPLSDFWGHLQQAHDALAAYYLRKSNPDNRNTYALEDRWLAFCAAIIEAAKRVDA